MPSEPLLIALVYAPAEYCAPTWCRSAHIHKVGLALSEAMRTITDCLWATPLDFLPCLSGFLSLNIRKNSLCINLHTKAEKPDHLLHQILHGPIVPTRLKPRKTFRPFIDNLL